MASVSGKVLIIIACVLTLIGFAVALGGVAKFNDMCNDATDDAGGCGRQLQYQWWGIWFSFFMAIVILVMFFLGSVYNWVSTLQALLAACLSVTMIDARSGIDGAAINTYNDDVNAAADAVAAGFVIASFGLFMTIIVLGMGSGGMNVSVGKVSPGSKSEPKPGEAA